MKWRGVEHMPRLYELSALKSEGRMRRLRQHLSAPLRGRILEIGCGSGLNLPHYQAAATIVASDLDPINLRYAARKRQRANLALLAADGQALPFAARSFDHVVATLVLCSVPSPAAALAEIARVVRPDGRLHLIEHMLSHEPRLNRLLHAIERPWCWVTGGCHPNRATANTLVAQGWQIETQHDYLNGLLRLLIAAPPPG